MSRHNIISLFFILSVQVDPIDSTLSKNTQKNKSDIQIRFTRIPNATVHEKKIAEKKKDLS